MTDAHRLLQTTHLTVYVLAVTLLTGVLFVLRETVHVERQLGDDYRLRSAVDRQMRSIFGGGRAYPFTKVSVYQDSAACKIDTPLGEVEMWLERRPGLKHWEVVSTSLDFPRPIQTHP